jgi:hypothetical protein
MTLNKLKRKASHVTEQTKFKSGSESFSMNLSNQGGMEGEQKINIK